MIESRIPGGRYVTSILICLLVLTAATAPGIYLYHSLILPMVLGISSLRKTGQVAPSTLGAMAGSLIGSAIVYISFRFTVKVLIEMQDTVLADYRKFNSGLETIIRIQDGLRRAMEDMEARVSALEK
jgi:hypothetical protein